MMTFDFLEKNERDYAMASLLFAQKLGLVDNYLLTAVEQRRQEENRKRRETLERGEILYGPVEYNPIAYLQQELTGFRLDYVSESEKITNRQVFRPISPEETRQFYEEHADLFTRYQGDAFAYEDVELIIRKKIREKDYEDGIKDILRQLRKGK